MRRSPHPLIRAWRTFAPAEPPYILPGDEALLSEPTRYTTDRWREYVRNLECGSPEEAGKLCLGLLPMPFVGNIETASIFLLMLNPGARPHDFFGESEVPEYAAALRAALRQELKEEGLLDVRFAWHGRYGYWERKFSKLFARLATRGKTYGEARQGLQSTMAALELVPYHSARYALPDRLLERLTSVALMRAYVRDVLVPRARRGDALIIVGRAKKKWGNFPASANIVAYEGSSARSAHLTPESSGGKAILRFVARKRKA